MYAQNFEGYLMITFREINMEDIPLIHAWFNEPHVQEFYSLRSWTENEVLDKLLPMIKRKKPLYGYLALMSGVPVGYLQYCAVKDFPWPKQDFDPSIVNRGAGVDFFIGDPTLIGKGLGPKIMARFLDTVIWPHFKFCVVDPDVKNLPSVRMFEKCGFEKHKKIGFQDALGKPASLWLMMKESEDSKKDQFRL
jgi:Acetyltransferases, including N-acetylases of ribosomal proteins